MKITFKAKSYINALGKETIQTPKKFSRGSHIVYRSWEGEAWDTVINSDMLNLAINRKINTLKLHYINLDSLPDCVIIQEGFLKQVTIDLGSTY